MVNIKNFVLAVAATFAVGVAARASSGYGEAELIHREADIFDDGYGGLYSRDAHPEAEINELDMYDAYLAKRELTRRSQTTPFKCNTRGCGRTVTFSATKQSGQCICGTWYKWMSTWGKWVPQTRRPSSG